MDGERIINITNKEFLQAIFGKTGYVNTHICAFPDDPSAITPSDSGRCWAGYLASNRKLSKLKPEDNQYFTVSQFQRDNEGNPRRRKNLFDAGFILVVDDVLEKIPLELANKLPQPSYKLYTSETPECSDRQDLCVCPVVVIPRLSDLLTVSRSNVIYPSGIQSGCILLNH